MLQYIFIVICAVSIYAAPISDDLDIDNVESLIYDGNNDEARLWDQLGDNLFEGDMLLTDEQKLAILSAQESRNGLLSKASRWPDQVVVYYIEEKDFDRNQVKLIMDAMADISGKSCVKFRPRRDINEPAVHIQGTGNECVASVGYNTATYLKLGYGCLHHGTVVHELMHILGFFHMQSTYDRDNFVRIVWENIIPDKKGNFLKYGTDTVTDFGVPYDYGSLMHYDDTAFTINKGMKTIIPLQENAIIGQNNGLSESDIRKLNLMYCGAGN